MCAAAPRKGRTAILDRMVEVTSWSRDHARQQLAARLRQPPGRAVAIVVVIDQRKTRSWKCSYDVRLVLQKVWAVSGRLRVSDGLCERGWDDLKEIDCGQDSKEQGVVQPGG